MGKRLLNRKGNPQKNRCKCGRLKCASSKRCKQCKKDSPRGLAWNHKIKKYDATNESFKMKALNLNDKKYTCDKCGEEFRLKGALNTHKHNCLRKKF